MTRQTQRMTVVAALLATATTASAQFPSFTNQTGTRLPTGAGQNVAALTTTCPEEKDYSWGDVDHDGDLDCVVMRKRPLSCTGGRQNLLLMNEGGILIDRSATRGNTALGVPGSEGVSQGMLDPTNDRQCILIDVNNDGWLDYVTCTTMSEGQQRYIGYPRVYMNLGESGGVWQGFRYEYARIPLFAGMTAAQMPRFCGIAAGDLTGDGYADLFFVDYDGPEGCYCTATGGQPGENGDFNNRVLINQGAANPGFFIDDTASRLAGSSATFGAHALIADFDADGDRDLMWINTLTGSLRVWWHSNSGSGNFGGTQQAYAGSPYGVSTADLNNNGTLDLIVSDDGLDYSVMGNNGSFSAPVSLPGSVGEFSGQNSIYDLDNDGWMDAFIPDQDIDTNFNTGRVMHFYRNSGGVFSGVQPIPSVNAKAVYNVAVFDINGDGWRDIILGRGNPTTTGGIHNVGSTEVWMSAGKPALAFSYPAGQPSSLVPNTATNFNVQINGLTSGTLQAGTARIFISVNGGAFTLSNLTSLGGNLFQATIPGQDCPTSIRYYFAGTESGGTVFRDPPGAPTNHYLVAASDTTQTIMNENFEGGAGAWTVQNDAGLTSGAWEVASPNATWNEGVRAAPNADASGVGVNAFVTQNGSAGGALSAADVDGGATHLISPAIDLAGSNATVSFSRWFYSSGRPGVANSDVMQISVSNNNGGSWVTVRNIDAPPLLNFNGPAEYTQTAWTPFSFQVGDYVTPTNQVRVRITVSDVADGTASAGIVEAGIDDFTMREIICNAQPCGPDVTGNGFVDIDDLLGVINAWGPCPGCPADVTGNGMVDIDDLLAVINGWGPCP